MKTRFKIVTSALALILAIGGGTVTFGGSNRGRESNKDASESTRSVNLEDTGFAGSWTGQGFTATIANNGTGTVSLTQLQCVATLSFTSLVDHVLTLRYVVTVDPGAHCIRTGVIAARMNAKNSSTWNFVGEDGSTLSGSATRVITPRVDRELLASFAGTATGGVAPLDFVVTIDKTGNGTITFPTLQCSGTITFISFDNVVVKGRLQITAQQGPTCSDNGIISSTRTGPCSSTWTFVGDHGGSTTGVTVGTCGAPKHDHSCDHASEKVARLAKLQSDMGQRISKLSAQVSDLSSSRTKAVLAGQTKRVEALDKRIAGIQRNIEHKQSQMDNNDDEEQNAEHNCNIAPPPPPTITCPDATVHNLPFVCPVEPSTTAAVDRISVFWTSVPVYKYLPDLNGPAYYSVDSAARLTSLDGVLQPYPSASQQQVLVTASNTSGSRISAFLNLYNMVGTPFDATYEYHTGFPVTFFGAPGVYTVDQVCLFAPLGASKECRPARGVEVISLTLPPPTTITCPDGSVHVLPFTCSVSPTGLIVSNGSAAFTAECQHAPTLTDGTVVPGGTDTFAFTVTGTGTSGLPRGEIQVGAQTWEITIPAAVANSIRTWLGKSALSTTYASENLAYAGGPLTNIFSLVSNPAIRAAANGDMILTRPQFQIQNLFPGSASDVGVSIVGWTWNLFSDPLTLLYSFNCRALTPVPLLTIKV